MAKYITIGAFILIGVIASFFTVSNRSVLKFNDATVDNITAVDSKFLNITKIMDVYSDGKAIDADKLGKEITESESGMASIIAQIESAEVPKSDICKDFHSSVLGYTKNSQVIITVYKEKVLPYVKLHNPPSDQDSSAVESMLAESIAEDARQLELVKTSQAAMAKKYKIKLQ